MTISPQNPVCPLADKGFLVTDAQTLPSLINAHPTVLVLLQSTVLSAVWRDYIAGKNTLSGWPHC